MINKQEAIEKLESRAFDIEDTDLVVGLSFAKHTINQIDAPKKPIVPQFVADWYEDNKDEFEYNVYDLCVKFHEYELNGEIKNWFDSMNNKPIQTLVNMHQFGYEVEEDY